MMRLKAPFPYFGGKSRIAAQVWQRFGQPAHYIEPFFGSGAVLLARPDAPKLETVNDADGLLANFWRAVQSDPDAVAAEADWPVNEADLHARHLWLVGQRERLTERLIGDPEFYDTRAAGWWVWGACCWIGGGWCTGKGPWMAVDGVLIDARKLPHLGDAGRGVNRQLPHLGDAGCGVNRQLPHLGDAGRGVFIRDWFRALAVRMRDVRVACGDWSRVVGPSVLRAGGGVCAVFLDPPYTAAEHSVEYAGGTGSVAADARAWAIEHGDDPNLRIALCGYAGEHEMPAGWSVMRWKAHGGYGNRGNGRGRENARRETVWFSPHCLPAEEPVLAMEATP